MGVSMYDQEAGQRRLEAVFPLEYGAGVTMLLKNYQLFAERAILAGNFAAIDMLLDLDEAIAAAYLTDRSWQCVQLCLIQDHKIEDVAAALGIDKAAVSRHVSGAVRKIADNFRYWKYNDNQITHQEDDADVQDGEL